MRSFLSNTTETGSYGSLTQITPSFDCHDSDFISYEKRNFVFATAQVSNVPLDPL